MRNGVFIITHFSADSAVFEPRNAFVHCNLCNLIHSIRL